jgi:hypothetical protein
MRLPKITINMPRVSIITALHNKEAYVADTIGSVLAQTLPDWELIVVENGSTDDGPVIVRQFSDPRIRLVVSPRQGPGAARNFGLRLAAGEWILFLDADDLIKRDYLECRLAAANHAPEAKIVAGPWHEFEDGNPGVRNFRHPVGWMQERSILDASSFAYAPWVIHAALARQDHLISGRFWIENLDSLPSEDCAFWFPVIYKARVVWSECGGALYRKRVGSSRDDKVLSAATGFRACMGTIQCNLNFLKNQRDHPSSQQIANVVRVLRRILQKAEARRERIVPDIRVELHRWLRATSYLDFRMLYWRFKFGEFRRQNL